MGCDMWERFASKLGSLDEAPEPLRGVMASALAGERACLLIFGPAWKIDDRCSPASILAVLADGWIIVRGTEEIAPTVYRAAYADTLFIELKAVMLSGRLTLGYAVSGSMQSAIIEFNTVMEKFFDEAIRLIRGAFDGVPEPIAPHDGIALSMLEGMPLRFVNAARRFLPQSQRLIETLCWQAVVERRGRWIRRQRELAPGAMLALTENELILIADESIKDWTWFGEPKKYGDIVIYYPLVKLAGFHIEKQDAFGMLQIEARSDGGGGHREAICFPDNMTREIQLFMQRAIARRGELRR